MFRIVGTGSFLPEKVLTNNDLERMIETTDEWITKRTGIKERRIAADEDATSDLAIRASQKAIEAAGITAEDIDMIIVGTSTPDYQIPSTAPVVQHKLGCRKWIPSFDVNSVCSSFAYAMLTANGIFTTMDYEYCLVIGADIYSRIMNWKDRGACIIFGDGAGAMVLKKDKSAKGLLAGVYGVDGSGADLIKLAVGGSRQPWSRKDQYEPDDFYFKMEGRKVYEFTIKVLPQVITDLLSKSKLEANQVDWYVLHQANQRIIESISDLLEVPMDKFIMNIQKVGNTSSASIPIAADEAVREGKIKRGDKVLMLGFGGGLSWGGALIEW